MLRKIYFAGHQFTFLVFLSDYQKNNNFWELRREIRDETKEYY